MNAMNLNRCFLFFIILAFVTCVMTCGSVSAQEGEKSLPELSAQAQKIKPWKTTEAEVISLLGQPSKTFEESRPIYSAKQFLELKKLIYGPENNIVVIIDKRADRVTKVNIKPSE